MYYKESWAPKNWCFWTAMLEKTLKSPLDCKKIQPVHPKGDQPWVFIGRTDVETESPILWPPMGRADSFGKTLNAGKDWGQEEKGTTEHEMVGWHHRLNAHGFRWTPGVGDRQRGLACCSSWGCKESDTTEWLNWTDKQWHAGPPRYAVKWKESYKTQNNMYKMNLFMSRENRKLDNMYECVCVCL